MPSIYTALAWLCCVLRAVSPAGWCCVLLLAPPPPDGRDEPRPLASATCHWRLAGTLAATGRQSAARYWGSSSEKKGTMAKSVRAPPLAPVHPAPHSRAPRERLFRWQSKAGGVATAHNFNLKGCGTSAAHGGGVWREKNRYENFTAAASDFTAERCLQLTAPFIRHPFNLLALYSCHQKGTWLTTCMFRLLARPCQAATLQDL